MTKITKKNPTKKRILIYTHKNGQVWLDFLKVSQENRNAYLPFEALHMGQGHGHQSEKQVQSHDACWG